MTEPGKPYTLRNYFANKRKQELEEKAQQPQQKKDVPSWVSIDFLPPNDPLRKRKTWEHFNPGQPYPEDVKGG